MSSWMTEARILFRYKTILLFNANPGSTRLYSLTFAFYAAQRSRVVII